MLKFQKFKKQLAFTLVELIIVIAVITLLSGIVVITIQPQNLFINSRNSQRLNDLNTIQMSINKYFSDSPINVSSRTMFSFTGYSTLLTNASSGISSCIDGANGNNLSTVTTPYNMDTLGGDLINLSPLISGGYLPKVPKDPLSNSAYKICIDILNNSQPIIYAPSTEGGLTYISVTLGNQSINNTVVDRFNRQGVAGSNNLGTAETGQSWAWSIASGADLTNNTAQLKSGLNLGLISSGKSNCTVKGKIINNVSGNWGIAFRISDGSNFWYVGTNGTSVIQLNKRQAGTVTSVASTGVNFVNGDQIEIVLSGQNIYVKRNSQLILSYNDASNFLTTSTAHGLYGTLNSYFDDFYVSVP